MLATFLTALGAASSDGPLDLMCVDDAFPPKLSLRGSSLYEFTGGEKGTNIGDGGNDMYDGGNEIHLRVNGQWTDALKYTQQCTGAVSEPAGKGDAMYATCKTSGSDPPSRPSSARRAAPSTACASRATSAPTARAGRPRARARW